MIQKILVFLLFLAVLTQAYTEENGILVLEGKDLDTITETFPNLFIEFYVPWYTCGYVGANIVRNWLQFLTKSQRNLSNSSHQVEIESFSPDCQDEL